MATRFLALLPRGAEGGGLARLAQTRTEYTPLIENDAVILLVEQLSGALRLGDDRGAILGWLFRRDTNRRVTKPDLAGSASGEMEALLSRCWGSSVALASDPSAGRVTVSRDPSGLFPCFTATVGEATLIFSDMETLLRAGIADRASWAIYWEALGRHLQAANLPTTQTALADVRELLPRFTLTLDRAGVHSQPSWSPWDHVCAPNRTDENLAAELREVVARCIDAWAGAFDHILLTCRAASTPRSLPRSW